MIKLTSVGTLGSLFDCTPNVFSMCPLGKWALVPSEYKRRIGCHELAFFTFFSLLFYCIDTCCYSPKVLFKHKLTFLDYPFRLLTLFQTIKNIKSACIRTHDVANTTLKLQRTTRFETRPKTTGYLVIGKNDRTRDPL